MNNSLVVLNRQGVKKRRICPEYKTGNLVKIHHSGISRNSQYSKLEPAFLCTYAVSAIYHDTNNYTLECPLVPSGHLKVHTSLLAPWHQIDKTKFPFRYLPGPGPTEFVTQGLYVWAKLVEELCRELGSTNVVMRS